MLQRRFDQLTDPGAHTLVTTIQRQQGNQGALLVANLLVQRRAERVDIAGA